MARLAVGLLGSFQVTLDGKAVIGFESDKVRALLAYLTVEAEGPHRREKLAGLLWPDWPERAARTNLRRALANLRRVIGDHRATPPFLHISRQTIQFNSASDAWVDVAVFTNFLEAKGTPQQTIHHLGEAVELYRGGFLEGFSVGDSPAFEEWALLNRERFHRLVMEAFRRLADCHEQRGEYERALQHAWRQVELDPWREEAHQQLMRLLALSGQRGTALAQYGTCRRLLAEGLGVEPAAETTWLYEQIRDGKLSVGAREQEGERDLTVALPAFVTGEGAVDVERLVFVARERELAKLGGFLDASLAGQGRVAFVTGDAGRGKTALVRQFTRCAQEAHPDLVVASGHCNAHTGIGDPYLPFREVLDLLTGDVTAWWAAGAISRKHARRLWNALPLAAQALVECGPDLVDTFVSGTDLVGRAAAYAPGPGRADWTIRLDELVERKMASSGAPNLQQDNLFEQYTRVLRALARQVPLLLVLDDLQWADAGSISLLFHLGRRIEGSRMLIVGAYRPEEVALGRPAPLRQDYGEPPGRRAAQGEVGAGLDVSSAERQGERHPLEKVLTESKRLFGDVWVDLDRAAETEGRRFVDAFLDAEPNRLGEAFRRALFQQTGGHPLFTVELLRAMQERGDLVRDKDGRWVEGLALDWETLPARVEGVIEERVGRLGTELREILSVASVEGEDFTAQVVARVQGIGERQFLRELSQELEKRHCLVREQGEVQVGRRRLSRYRFTHALFQEYLYRGLSVGERRLLHREIASALEELYEGHTEEIAVQLAHHYAGDAGRERHYARLAGERAAAQFAAAEAVVHLSRALDLTPETDHAERYVLLLTREKMYDMRGDREAQSQDLQALEGLAEALADDQRRAEVALCRANYAEATSDYEAAIVAAKAAIRLAPRAPARSADETAQGAPGTSSEAAGHRLWGLALWRQGNYEAAQLQLEQALARARAVGLRQVEADSLRILGAVSSDRGDYGGARTCYEQALSIYRDIGDRRGEGGALNNLGVVFLEQGDYAEARAHYEQALRIFREIGDRLREGIALGNLGTVSYNQGDHAGARPYFEQALPICREVGDRQGEGRVLNHLGLVYIERGDYARARTYCEQALRIKQEIGDRRGEGQVLNNLGLAFQSQGDYARAKGCHEQSLRIKQKIGDRRGEGYALQNLGEIFAAQGDYAQARTFHEQSLRVRREIGDRQGEGSGLSVLGLLSHHLGADEAAREYSQQALLVAQDLGNRDLEGCALTHLGHALAGLGRLAEAAAAYREALVAWRELSQHNMAMEPLAGLARVSLAHGDLAGAQAHVEEILRYLETNALDGTDEPLRVYLTCYRVLRAGPGKQDASSQDPRAPAILSSAHRLLQERAAKTSDEELRRSFLENVAAHREILSEWAEQL
jgi:adenylate cyclase